MRKRLEDLIDLLYLKVWYYPVDLVPLALEALSNFPNLFLGEALPAYPKSYLSSLLRA